MDPAAEIRAAIQALLDSVGDGWEVAQFVLCLGLERITKDGLVESAAWVWAPPQQPEWQTDGLLIAAEELRATADIDD